MYERETCVLPGNAVARIYRTSHRGSFYCDLYMQGQHHQQQFAQVTDARRWAEDQVQQQQLSSNGATLSTH